MTLLDVTARARHAVSWRSRRLAFRLRRFAGPTCLVDPPASLVATLGVIGARAVGHISPLRPRLRWLPPPPEFDLVCIYRARNSQTVEALSASVTGSSYLWALDRPTPELTNATVGFGAGSRFQNLNRLIAASDPDRWLVVADDDVSLSRADLGQAVSLALAAGLDLASPTHGPGSFLNWDVTRSRMLSIVRLTRFVDQGPLLILSPRARLAMTPFPEDLGMGWGVEVLWATLTDLSIGVLDAVPMRHLAPVKRGNYDVDAEWKRAQDLLAESPWTTWPDLQKELGRWERLRRTPPWFTGEARG